MAADPGPAPSRAEVEARLLDLIAGRCTRREAADWASRWVNKDDPQVDDDAVWEALGELAGADLISTDRPYLHGNADFEAWLQALRQAP